MTESEARLLAQEIILQPDWFAYPEQEPFEVEGRRGWWVRVRHADMHSTCAIPVISRAEWHFFHSRWVAREETRALETRALETRALETQPSSADATASWRTATAT